MRTTQTLDWWTTEAEYCLTTANEERYQSFRDDPECFMTYCKMQANFADRDGQPQCARIIEAARRICRLQTDAQTDQGALTVLRGELFAVAAQRDAARDEAAFNMRGLNGALAGAADVRAERDTYRLHLERSQAARIDLRGQLDAAIAEHDHLRGLLDSALAHVNTAEAERDAALILLGNARDALSDLNQSENDDGELLARIDAALGVVTK